ncbi:MAG: DALR domain-containing protein, partial [Chitinophagaceae bacterium]
AEKGLKRLWDAYQWIQTADLSGAKQDASDKELDEKVKVLIAACTYFMNDDFNTAKVLANMFEIVPILNGIKDKHIAVGAISSDTFQTLKVKMKEMLEDILGLTVRESQETAKLDGVLQLLIQMRKEAKARKDFATSDQIRNQLQQLGILLKDEKDGSISYTID